jgi:uncharacterized metal-binding protein YceD (DUF177 family)
MSIKINIGSLNDGSQQLELDTDSAELGLEENLINGRVHIILDLFKANNQLSVKANISGLFGFECDRCLEPFDRYFEQGLELVYAQKLHREEDYDDDYIRTYNPSMKTVDITKDIKEMVLLAVPMKRVPAEKPDGSCSWCGKTKEYWNRFIVDEEELEK